MINAFTAGCAGTLDEVGGANTLPIGPDGGLITGAKIGRDEWLSQTRAYRRHYTTLAESLTWVSSGERERETMIL